MILIKIGTMLRFETFYMMVAEKEKMLGFDLVSGFWKFISKGCFRDDNVQN